MEDVVVNLLKSLLVLSIQVSILVFIVVMAVLDRRAFKRHYRVGLGVGILCFVLAVPGAGFGLAHFDVSSIVSQMDLPFPPDVAAKWFLVAIALLGGVALVVRIGWHMVLYCVAAAEWERFKPDALPLLTKTGKTPWAWILAASAFGLAAGGVSALVFWAAGIDEGEAISRLRQLFPGASEASLFIRAPVTVLAISVPAIVEELIFRGAMLGFLLRLSKDNRVAIVASMIAVSLLWALIHVPNTDVPLVKCAQILIIGFVLAEFARRSCIEAAIAGHLSLNFAAAVAAFTVFPGA